MEGCSVFEHGVDNAGELVGGGDDGVFGTGSGADVTEVSAQSRRRPCQGLCREPQGLTGAIVGFE